MESGGGGGWGGVRGLRRGGVGRGRGEVEGVPHVVQMNRYY